MTTATQQAAEPKAQAVHHVRLGRISATVWKADTDAGPRFSVSLQRSYRLPEEQRSGNGDNGWRNTSFFGRDECLIVAEAARQAADWIFQQQRPQDQNGHGILTTLAQEVARLSGQQVGTEETPF